MTHPVDPLQAPRWLAFQRRLTVHCVPTGRQRGAALLTVAVVLAHALLLADGQRTPGHGGYGQSFRALQVRQIDWPGAPDVEPQMTAAPAAVPPSARQRGGSSMRRAAAPGAAPLLAPLVASPSAASGSQTGPVASANRPLDEADSGHEAASDPVSAGDRTAVPVYATRLPPPLLAHYELRRGGASGNAELQWSAGAGRYALSLRGGISGGPGFGWDSHGTLDSHGIAPERYTESRRGRELRAANFRRETAAITFSGPPIEQPLLPGTQDRLSWMLQLAAVLQADPALSRSGQEIVLFVAGSRGDAAVWVFDVLGLEEVEVADGGTLVALRLRRNPERLYDTAVDVWLDPARSHLPVRARLALRQGGVGTELLLRRVEMP